MLASGRHTRSRIISYSHGRGEEEADKYLPRNWLPNNGAPVQDSGWIHKKEEDRYNRGKRNQVGTPPLFVIDPDACRRPSIQSTERNPVESLDIYLLFASRSSRLFHQGSHLRIFTPFGTQEVGSSFFLFSKISSARLNYLIYIYKKKINIWR